MNCFESESSLLQELLIPIAGHEFKKKFTTYSKIIFPDFVSAGPVIALKKIESFFNVCPNLAGDTIEGINVIREAIKKHAKSKSLVKSCTIIAPHTHWSEGNPIIYHSDRVFDRYVIGPHPLVEDDIYTPVSFIFHKGTPMPFEWVSSNLGINAEEYSETIDLIKKVNEEVYNYNYPLGLSIDFRFKKSLYDNQIPTVELTSLNDDDDFSYIITSADFMEQELGEEIEQVSWHPFSNHYFDFSPDEIELLKLIRSLLATAPDKKIKSYFLRELETIVTDAVHIDKT